MFTGIVERTGVVSERDDLSSGAALIRISAPGLLDGVRHGDSISVDGVCLTVANLVQPGSGPAESGQGASGEPSEFIADVMPETLRRSTLGRLQAGASVNLERALRADARLGGHVVAGHVDAVGELLSREPGDKWDVLTFAVPDEMGRFLAEKGSVAVNGVSLTVVAVSAPGEQPQAFSVSLIPTTLSETNLGGLVPGDAVNIEVDTIARYVARLLEFDR